MAFDTFIVYVGVYADVEAAEADYELIKDLHTEASLIDAYDAAVIQRRDDGKVKIARKHEMRRAEKVQKKQLKADLEEIGRDAKPSASSGE